MCGYEFYYDFGFYYSLVILLTCGGHITWFCEKFMGGWLNANGADSLADLACAVHREARGSRVVVDV